MRWSYGRRVGAALFIIGGVCIILLTPYTSTAPSETQGAAPPFGPLPEPPLQTPSSSVPFKPHFYDPERCEDPVWYLEHMNQAGHRSTKERPWVNVLYNPSAVPDYSPDKQDSELLVIYRTRRRGISTVILRRFELVEQTDAAPPWLNVSKSGPYAKIDTVDHDQETQRRCEDGFFGFEDPRAVVLASRKLFIVANSHRHTDCKRCIGLLEIDKADFPPIDAASRDAVTLKPRSITFLRSPKEQKYEKNWTPFAVDSGTRLLLAYSINPHLILSCDVPGTGDCVEVATSSWSELPAFFHVGSGSLRGNSGGIERANDFLACGHWHQSVKYFFFFYTFSKVPPYELLAASRPFRFGDESIQYVSGMARVGEWYVLTYGIRNGSTDTAWIHACHLDRMLAEGLTRNKTLSIA